MRLPTIIAATAIAATAGVALAESHASLPPAVKARQAHMQIYAFNLGVLGAIAKGEMEYDAAVATAAATNLLSQSQMNQMLYWTPDTDEMSVDGSRALPALWENLEDAQAKGLALTTAAEAMVGAAGEGVEAIQAQMGAVGGACGACHKAYRAPES